MQLEVDREAMLQYWPRFPNVAASPIIYQGGRRGIIYYNRGEKPVYVRFDWKTCLPEYGIELWGPEGKVSEAPKPDLYNGEGGTEVCFCLNPGQYLAAIEKTTPAQRGEVNE